MAQNKETMGRLRKLFKDKGIIIKIRPVNRESEEESCYEILVPEAEISLAHEIIIEMGF